MFNKQKVKKSCIGCTRCCEGWLNGTVNDRKMEPGTPCFFLKGIGEGCSIYDNRPQDPCRSFECNWVIEKNNIPEKFKPSKSGVILIDRTLLDEEFVFLINAPRYPSKKLIRWCKKEYKRLNKNFVYFKKNGEVVYYGNQKFIDLMNFYSLHLKKEHAKLSKFFVK